MLAKVYSAGVLGIEAYPVEIEADVGLGLPGFSLVGLPDSAVKEGFTRVRSALEHSGFPLPPRRVTINLAPADVRKDGAAYDLPIAVSLLLAQNLFPVEALSGLLLMGELGLDGSVRRVLGSLPAALLCKQAGFHSLALPQINAREAACISGLRIHPLATLAELVAALRGERPMPELTAAALAQAEDPVAPLNLLDVRGNEAPKRALEIAAAGGHNLLYIGPPGTGKSMLARRLPGILPPPSESEAIETSAVYSAAGLLRGASLMRQRPFRAPHQDVSLAGLVGGGSHPRPGEISLAHNGVLFLDELPEFRRLVLEGLRQPLEEGRITIVRARYALTYPSRFSLIAAMNPCPCGYSGSAVRSCTCDIGRINRYRARISGPLLDRFDLHVEVPHVDYQTLLDPSRSGESSEAVLARVRAARQRQRERHDRLSIEACNAGLSGAQVLQVAPLDAPAAQLLTRFAHRHGLSSRAVHRVLRVSRTIADLAQSADVRSPHVAEALSLRLLDSQGA